MHRNPTVNVVERDLCTAVQEGVVGVPYIRASAFLTVSSARSPLCSCVSNRRGPARTPEEEAEAVVVSEFLFFVPFQMVK